MLATLFVTGTSLILALLCSVLLLPDDPGRQSPGRQLNGKAASENER
jgi:hypothetical protein